MPEGSKQNHPINKIKGVGPKISELLGNLGIFNVEDALFHLPYKYEDRTNPVSYTHLTLPTKA